jgi:ATP-dependent Clp protease ATP-binding subunit ClpC
MFERYTENARRVVFFARYEASQVGSPSIETEHLLLGLLREDKALTNRFVGSRASVESIRKQIEAHTPVREKAPAGIDLPLSNESKRVLAYAAEEADSLGHKHIGTEHLLLGILREEKCFASEILAERGLNPAQIRVEIPQFAKENAAVRQRARENSTLAEFGRDLTQAAMDKRLEPLVGRENEIEALVEALCSRINRNPLLICERGADGGALVEMLAQLIADGGVPELLDARRVWALDVEQMVGEAADGKSAKERLTAIVKELAEDRNSIIFIDEMQRLSQLDTAGIFRRALLNGEVQCIAACTEAGHGGAIKTMPWLGRCFRNIRVPKMLEADITRSLFARKDLLEKFHGVSYADEAVECAVRYSARYFPGDAPFDKAMEMLDAGGTRVKLRLGTLPAEIAESRKRIRFIEHRVGLAVNGHEFEKARFYSDQVRKERDNLRTLRDKYHLDDSVAGIVGSDDIAEVVSRWTGHTVPSIKGGQADEGGSTSAPAGAVGPLVGVRKSSSLRVFMCHASEDKPAVRDLYARLKRAQIEPWLDAEDILAGQEWRYEIEKAVRSTHIVLVCLSAHSTSKTGFVNKEIRIALDVADQQPEGTIFIIPLKLEECQVPDRLRQWQWVNLYEEDGFEKLMRALLECARGIGIRLEEDDTAISD